MEIEGGRVSLVGAGPGDPELWTVRGLQRVREADLVLYDALIDAGALRQLTNAQCFCVGKRAGRASVRQETIYRLMIRAARIINRKIVSCRTLARPARLPTQKHRALVSWRSAWASISAS